jgi:fucose permease
MKNYRHTLHASYIGYLTQSIVNNFAPLLFLTFQSTYAISIEQLALLIGINFSVQLLVDLLATQFVDKIGYRVSIVIAHFFSATGLVALGILPNLLNNAYAGLIIAVCVYAVGGGIIEVLISPIVEACPTKNKSGSMSLLHSFYCWGHVFIVLASTMYFVLIGIEHWEFLAMIWALVPLGNAFYFMIVPINTLVSGEEQHSVRHLGSKSIFWVLLLLMLCAGASELAVSQWSSAFAEQGLGVSKTMGDLLGPCLFAFMMGTSRVLYARNSERIKLEKFMILSGLLCIVSYLVIVFSPYAILSLLGCGLCGLSVGIFWPGSFSLSAKKIPLGGTALFALLALAGDFGAGFGPATVGFITDRANDDLKIGILVGIIFPILFTLVMVFFKKNHSTQLDPYATKKAEI